ncbi:MAG: hypothetical protein HYU77_15035 [Betaproteobacteria bacterium]|nr:hypothetical protein [Betaproteobacteria bacterium]
MGNGRMFRVDRLIRFADCDPAGIVYYLGDCDILGARAVLVATSLKDYRSVPIAEDLRARAQDYLAAAPAAATL